VGILRIAWRNLWRRSRRTVVTIGAMTLALLVLILYSGLVEGYLRDMERNILDLEFGDVQAYAGDYRDRPSIYTLIEDPEALLESLESRGYRATARLLGGGLVAAGDSSAGASFRGIDLARDPEVSEIYQHVSRGDWLDAADPKGVVLGRRLALTLDVDVGDELVFLSQATDGSMANDLFEVRGILLSVGDATDRAGVFLTAGAFREFFVLPEGTHQLILRRTGDQSLDEVAGAIRSSAPELDVKTWRELMPTMASMIDSTRAMIQVVFFVVYVVIAILVLNAMLMAVFERIREFGVMKAIGVMPGTVLRLILVESAYQTAISIAIGLVLSVPGLWYLTNYGIDTGAMGGISLMGVAFNQIWYAVVSPYTFVGPLAALIIMVMLAVLYPAIKAYRIEPLDAMRHQ
jgi:ABC-type lipoprotein release transport system permease subunit